MKSVKLPQARPETKTAAPRAQRQSQQSRRASRAAATVRAPRAAETIEIQTDTLSLRELVPAPLLAKLKEQCARDHRGIADTLAVALEAFLERGGTSSEPGDDAPALNLPSEHAPGKGEALATEGAIVFCRLYMEAAAQPLENAVESLRALYVLCEGNPRLALELHALGHIITGAEIMSESDLLDLERHRIRREKDGDYTSAEWHRFPQIDLPALAEADARHGRKMEEGQPAVETAAA